MWDRHFNLPFIAPMIKIAVFFKSFTAKGLLLCVVFLKTDTLAPTGDYVSLEYGCEGGPSQIS